MDTLELLALCRCCACGRKPIGRPNLIPLARLAQWDFPTAGNVVTGEHGRAVAVVCDECVEAKAAPIWAVEFRGGANLYHLVDGLEKVP